MQYEIKILSNIQRQYVWIRYILLVIHSSNENGGKPHHVTTASLMPWRDGPHEGLASHQHSSPLGSGRKIQSPTEERKKCGLDKRGADLTGGRGTDNQEGGGGPANGGRNVGGGGRATEGPGRRSVKSAMRSRSRWSKATISGDGFVSSGRSAGGGGIANCVVWK